jgi:hypothetical protein
MIILGKPTLPTPLLGSYRQESYHKSLCGVLGTGILLLKIWFSIYILLNYEYENFDYRGTFPTSARPLNIHIYSQSSHLGLWGKSLAVNRVT